MRIVWEPNKCFCIRYRELRTFIIGIEGWFWTYANTLWYFTDGSMPLWRCCSWKKQLTRTRGCLKRSTQEDLTAFWRACAKINSLRLQFWFLIVGLKFGATWEELSHDKRKSCSWKAITYSLNFRYRPIALHTSPSSGGSVRGNNMRTPFTI